MSGDTPTPESFAGALAELLELELASSPQAVRVEVARLRAESRVLASVVEALEDPDRPEESPVDAVRRLRAEVKRLDMQLRVEGAVRAKAQADGEQRTRERDSDRMQVVGYYIAGTHGNRPPTIEELRAGAASFGYEYLYPEDSTTDETGGDQ